MDVTIAGIHVHYSESYQAISMNWGRVPTGTEVRRAFREINAFLDTLTEPVCVVVDLRANIHMPLKETITGALFGPYNHPKVTMWLVIGENAFAESVARTLITVTRQDKVAWFKDEQAVDAYLMEHCPRRR